jgi:Flp pilus assembly protein TadG
MTGHHEGMLRRRWRSVAAHRDRGAATVEFVLATPLLVLMLMLIIQAGLWMHASHIAQAAAESALEAARVQGGTAAAGRRAGRAELAALAGGSLQHTTVTVTRTATTTRVRITGSAEALIPGWHWQVTATAAARNENFIPSGGR